MNIRHTLECIAARLVLAAVLLTASPAQSQAPPSGGEVSLAAVEERIKVLDQEDTELQQAALTSLVKLGGTAEVHLSVILLDPKRSWAARTGAAWVLGELLEPKSAAALNEAWSQAKAPGTFRMQVAMALGALGDKTKLRTFLDPKGDKILAAKGATALANLQDKGAVELMKPLLGDEDIGAFIALAMGRLGEGSVKQTVKDLMKEPIFRDHAAVALGAMGDRTAMMPLRFALANPDPFIRRDAATILGRLKDTGALGQLEALAEDDPDARVRDAAARAAKRLRPRGRRR